MAELGEGVALGPGVVVRRGARVGARSVLWANAYVGVDAVVGEDCELFPGVYLGARCALAYGSTVSVWCAVCVLAARIGRFDRHHHHHDDDLHEHGAAGAALAVRELYERLQPALGAILDLLLAASCHLGDFSRLS